MDIKAGDHIYVYLRQHGIKFTHHGIYIGDNIVIHYWEGKIRRSRLRKKKWLKKRIHKKRHKKYYKAERVIRRAKRRLGEKKYHLIFNNCEHFAYWCKTGKSRSKQVTGRKRIKPLRPIRRIWNKVRRFRL